MTALRPTPVLQMGRPRWPIAVRWMALGAAIVGPIVFAILRVTQ